MAARSATFAICYAAASGNLSLMLARFEVVVSSVDHSISLKCASLARGTFLDTATFHRKFSATNYQSPTFTHKCARRFTCAARSRTREQSTCWDDVYVRPFSMMKSIAAPSADRAQRVRKAGRISAMDARRGESSARSSRGAGEEAGEDGMDGSCDET